MYSKKCWYLNLIFRSLIQDSIPACPTIFSCTCLNYHLTVLPDVANNLLPWQQRRLQGWSLHQRQVHTCRRPQRCQQLSAFKGRRGLWTQVQQKMGNFPKQKHLSSKIFKRHKSWRKGWPHPDLIKKGATVFPTGKVGSEE